MRKKQREAAGWVYLLRTGWHYKIGKTKNVKARVADLQTSSPYLIELIWAVYDQNMHQFEAWLHREFAEYRTNGEWFELPPDQIPVIEGMMLCDVDVLWGDVGDDRNWLIYMETDYVIKRKLKESLWGDEWFPNEEIAEGWGIWFACRPCLCVDGGSIPDGTVCAWCGGYKCLITDDTDVLCGDKKPNPTNSRQITRAEAQLLAAYLKWQELEHGDDEDGEDAGDVRTLVTTAPHYMPREGERVSHSFFGDGIVLSVQRREEYNDWDVVVKWVDKTRVLALSFANLKPITP
jgi:hypothetical protein